MEHAPLAGAPCALERRTAGPSRSSSARRPVAAPADPRIAVVEQWHSAGIGPAPLRCPRADGALARERVDIQTVTSTETPRLEYRIPDGCRDELLDDQGQPLPHAGPLIAALERLGPDALQAAGRRRDTIFMQQGITFEVAGSDGERRDRAWPLDLVPRVLTAAEWTTIKRGLAQRIRALNAFVDDVYHAHEIVRAGIVPWSLIVSRPSFARPVHGVRAPGGVYCHVCGGLTKSFTVRVATARVTAVMSFCVQLDWEATSVHP